MPAILCFRSRQLSQVAFELQARISTKSVVLFATIFLTFSITGSLFAQQKSEQLDSPTPRKKIYYWREKKGEESCKEECKCTSCTPCKSDCYCYDCCYASERKWEFRLGFLYWYASQGNLFFTNKQQSTFTTGDFTTSSLIEPDFCWKPGFELAGYTGCCDSCWTYGFSLKHYRGRASEKKTAKRNFGMFPVLSFARDTLPSDYVTSAKVNWKLNTTIWDLEARCRWDCFSCFFFDYSAGVRNVWTQQKVNARYQGATYNAGTDKVRLQSDLYGIGPRVGIYPVFFFCNCFSLYGEVAGSVLLGLFDITQKETFLSKQRAGLEQTRTKAVWNGDFAIGLKYLQEFAENCCCIKCLDVDVGFDALLFSEQYQFENGPQFSVKREGKTLTLYGIHVAVGLHF